MNHDHDVSVCRERFAVASLSVAPVSVILVVHVILQSELFRNFDGAVRAMVIDQNFDIDNIRKFTDGVFERFFGVVGGKHHRNALAVNH